MESTFILSDTTKPSKAERDMLRILQGGAGHGALKNLSAIDRFNRRSTRYRICPTYADPSPGRTEDLLAQAEALGVEAFGVESRVEEAASALDPNDPTPIVLQIDRATDIARTLAATREISRIVFVYLLMKQGGELVGLRCYLRPDRPEARATAERFFGRVGEITLPQGSAALLGEGADAEDIAREPLYRAWFADHLMKNLPKAVAGLESECAPCEITTDGRVTKTLHLVEGERFSDPVALASAVLRAPTTPIERGRDFVLGEFGPEGVRFHAARRRKVDGELSIRGVALPERATAEAQALLDARDDDGTGVGEGRALSHHDPEVLAVASALAQVLATTVATTLSATNPVQTTD